MFFAVQFVKGGGVSIVDSNRRRSRDRCCFVSLFVARWGVFCQSW